MTPELMDGGFSGTLVLSSELEDAIGPSREELCNETATNV